MAMPRLKTPTTIPIIESRSNGAGVFGFRWLVGSRVGRRVCLDCNPLTAAGRALPSLGGDVARRLLVLRVRHAHDDWPPRFLGRFDDVDAFALRALGRIEFVQRRQSHALPLTGATVEGSMDHPLSVRQVASYLGVSPNSRPSR